MSEHLCVQKWDNMWPLYCTGKGYQDKEESINSIRLKI
jgi:hypothetical protein